MERCRALLLVLATATLSGSSTLRAPATVLDLLERWSNVPEQHGDVFMELYARSPRSCRIDLTSALDDPRASIRRAATEAVYALLSPPFLLKPWWELDDPQRELESALVQRLGDPELRVRTGAAGALMVVWVRSRPRVDDPTVRAAVIDLLSERDSFARFAGAALIPLGFSELGAFEPLLTDAMDDADPGTRFGTMFALTSFEVRSPEVFSRLFRALDDPDEQVRRVATRALGKAPGFADQSIPRLFGILRDTAAGDDVRQSAAAALVEICVEPSVAERLLEELLARRFVLCRDTVLGGSPDGSAWVRQVGITAARVPRSPLAPAARAAIEEEWESDAEAECIAALARLAVAQRDLALASNMKPLVEEWLSDVPSWGVMVGDESIVEGAVVLASWPAVGFPRDELLTLLHDVAGQGESLWQARWAKEQLRKLE